MSRLMLLRGLTVFLLSSLTPVLFGQNVQSSQTAQTAVPVTMTECEGINNCATWTFLGGQGNGQWPSGNIANLTVERFDETSVVIRRADSTGPSAGLTATYNGTRKDDQIGGDFTSSWPGHWDNKSGKWYAIIGKPAQNPPPLMRSCTTPGFRYCWTYTWKDGHYDGLADNGQTAVLNVVSFSPDSVIFKIALTGRDAGYTATNTGKISPLGNTIVDGDWSDSNGGKGRFTATWGTALGDLPKAARAPAVTIPRVAPVVCVPWFFTVICN